MPRRADKRLRLVIVDRGYDLDARKAAAVPCECGAGSCTHGDRMPSGGKVTRAHRATWQTADGRFVLQWTSSCSSATKSRPEGALRVEDLVRGRIWFTWSIRDALAEIARLYDRAGVKRPAPGPKRKYPPPPVCPGCGSDDVVHVNASRAHVCKGKRCGRRFSADCAPYKHGGSLK